MENIAGGKISTKGLQKIIKNPGSKYNQTQMATAAFNRKIQSKYFKQKMKINIFLSFTGTLSMSQHISRGGGEALHS